MRNHHPLRTLLVVSAAVALSACATTQVSEEAPLATAPLTRSDGLAAGTAQLLAEGTTLVLRLRATGLPPGQHGVHLHTIGRCDRPDFASAGGHWNPSARQHGSANSAGPHAGDLPNLIIAPDGSGSLELPLNGEAAAAGHAALFDSDGTALVIHAAADDMRTDPSGASGARIACGVLSRS